MTFGLRLREARGQIPTGTASVARRKTQAAVPEGAMGWNRPQARTWLTGFFRPAKSVSPVQRIAAAGMGYTEAPSVPTSANRLSGSETITFFGSRLALHPMATQRR